MSPVEAPDFAKASLSSRVVATRDEVIPTTRSYAMPDDASVALTESTIVGEQWINEFAPSVVRQSV